MEHELEFLKLQVSVLQEELAKKDAELLKTKENLTEALKYINEYVQTLEVIQSEL